MEDSARAFGTRRSPSADMTGDESEGELFCSPAETPDDRAAASPLPFNLSLGGLSEQANVEVVVHPVRNRDDYINIPEEYVIKRVAKELGVFDGVSYHKVVLGTGLRVSISDSRLIRLTNGQTELDQFQAIAALSRSRHKHDLSISSLSTSSSDADDDLNSFYHQSSRGRNKRLPGTIGGFVVESSDEDQQIFPTTNRMLRHRRGRQVRAASEPDDEHEPGSSSDEEASEDEGSNFGNSPKTVGRRLRKRKRRRSSAERHRRKRFTHGGSGSSSRPGMGPQTQGVRRSERVGRPVKSMRERTEDEIWNQEIHGTGRSDSRAVGARETFKRQSDAEFRLRHQQTCDTCGDYGDSDLKGLLVFCQGCVLAHHKGCLGHRNSREHLVTKIADNDFVLQCRRCVNAHRKKEPKAPRLDICQVCEEAGPSCAPFRDRKTAKQEDREREENGGEDPVVEVDQALVNNIESILFRCQACKRAFHFEHLPPPNPFAEEDADEANAAEIRFTQYNRDWACLDCRGMPGKLQALVAWRPTDPDDSNSGFTVDMVDEDEKEYLVKWQGRSYLQASWMPGAWVWGVTAVSMRKAFAKRDHGYNLPKPTTDEAVPEEYVTIDIVLDVEYLDDTVADEQSEEAERDRVKDVEMALVKYKGLGYDEIVWEEVPKPEDGNRWAEFVLAYNDWVLGRHIHLPNQKELKEKLKAVRTRNFQKTLLKKKQPSELTGGKMMDYQLEGLNWLLYKWYQSQNAILADEMGLGKTIQVIGLLTTLVHDRGCWPFLIVVPNSTCLNWRREIKRWAPSLRAVAFYGSAEAREVAMTHELCGSSKRDLKCHIVITSYETPVADDSRAFLKRIPWAGLVVDEGQRLKNDKNLLYGALSSLKVPFKILLTGTPLQNNTRELFNLLQFVDSSLDAEELEEEYAVLDAEAVARLHDLIRPYFLRRTKAQVLTFLPPMAQIIIPVSMTVLQKRLYKSILARNPDLVKSIFRRETHQLKKAERSNLNNILMQLRKCLCHPFIYSKSIEERTLDAAVSHRTLVDASSKLRLLEIMLPALKERGHRVLIFSQFLEMLSIVEDFLDGLGLSFERLDGNTGSLQKQEKIDAFNAPGSSLFAFLLSTRAGGVGINLATADTVIIMDPDFNPHQDIQALSRAHRIGQQKKVLVFQLVTRDSAEEKIVQIGRKKMALDHVLIEKMDAEDESELDLSSILKHGAAALFDDDDERDIRYDAASVEKLLDRTQAENTKTNDEKSAESQFSFARVWANDQGDLQDGLKDSEAEDTMPDPSIWDKLLVEREQDAARRRAEAQETFGRGKRRRVVVDYAQQAMLEHSSPLKAEAEARSDADFDDPHVEDDEYETDEGGPDADQIHPDELGQLGARGMPRGISPSGASAVGAPRQTYAQNRPPARPGASTTVTTSKIPNPLPYYAWPSTAGLGTTPSGVGSGSSSESIVRKCPVCGEIHQVGYCPLKLAGYQLCPLCNLAHFGQGRTCPNLRDEEQVSLMIEGVKQSPEDKETKDAALKYLRGIKGDLARRRRTAAAKMEAENARIEAEKVAATSGRAAYGVEPAVHAPPTGVFAHPPSVSRAPAGAGRGHGPSRGPSRDSGRGSGRVASLGSGHGSSYGPGQMQHPGQGHQPGGPAFGIHVPSPRSSTHNTFNFDPSVPAQGTSFGSLGDTQGFRPGINVFAAGSSTQHAPVSQHTPGSQGRAQGFRPSVNVSAAGSSTQHTPVPQNAPGSQHVLPVRRAGAQGVGLFSRRPSSSAASATQDSVPAASANSGNVRGGAPGGARGGAGGGAGGGGRGGTHVLPTRSRDTSSSG